MIHVRVRGEEIQLEPEEWAQWLEDGRIPPGSQVFVEGAGWIPVPDHPDHARLREGAGGGVRTAGRTGDPVLAVLFPRRGVSATEILILLNLAVAAVLVLVLGNGYLPEVRGWTAGWWRAVRGNHEYWWWIPTLFLHAGPGHLARNMVSLAAGAGAVEFLAGRRWALAAYLVTGLGGAWLSYAGHGQPPLSIGASGAVFGLVGCAGSFLLRRHRLFSYRQRWKTRRVYVPLFVAFLLPSILGADYHAHVGGFLTGVVLGFFLPAHPRVRARDDGERE